MTDFITWMGDVLGMDIATVGTTTVTLGLILVYSLIAGLALSVWRKARGRG